MSVSVPPVALIVFLLMRLVCVTIVFCTSQMVNVAEKSPLIRDIITTFFGFTLCVCYIYKFTRALVAKDCPEGVWGEFGIGIKFTGVVIPNIFQT